MLTIAFVRGVMRARTEAGSSHGSVRPTTSANTGVAPVYAIAFAVATNVSEGTMTSSPAPSPAAIAIRCRAAVQLVTATACAAPASGGRRRRPSDAAHRQAFAARCARDPEIAPCALLMLHGPHPDSGQST